MIKFNQTLLAISVMTLLAACDGVSTPTEPPKANGNKPQLELPIINKDTQAPTIKLIGNAIITLQRGSTYDELGATVIDNKDGNISDRVIITKAVNAAVLGQYSVHYDVMDVAGNKAETVVRLVNVVNTAPVISGTPKISTRIHDSYQFQPAASDSNNDKLTFSITNKPNWADFDPNTGRLSGIATELQTNSDIVISVSDGMRQARLKALILLLKER